MNQVPQILVGALACVPTSGLGKSFFSLAQTYLGSPLCHFPVLKVMQAHFVSGLCVQCDAMV